MAQSGLFRTALFGGYNREDVEEYIKNLEYEIESVKALHQKEKLELVRKAEESEGELTLVRSELEAVREDLKAVKEAGKSESGTVAPEPSALSDVDEGQIDALKLLEEELQKELQKGGHGISAQEAPGAASEGNEKEAEEAGKAALARLQQEYDRLARENQELREKLEKKDDLFDYDTVLKIMEEARDRALEEEERQRHMIASRANTYLEEKGIQLMAAKYKIEQYIKEINSIQQGLYLLNSRMEKMVKDMPVRIDDYWEGEDFRQLEYKEEKEAETDEGTKEADTRE